MQMVNKWECEKERGEPQKNQPTEKKKKKNGASSAARI